MDHAQSQGLDFMNYRNEYAKVNKNKHDLLGVSSSPEWGSLIEALDGIDSISQQQKVINDELNGYETQFNDLLSTYATDYKTYNSALLSRVSTPTNLQVMKAGLDAKYAQLVVLGQKINTDISQLQSINGNLNSAMQIKSVSIRDALQWQGAASYGQGAASYGQGAAGQMQDDMNGQLEVTSLNMNSFYYHYIVYFLISITLLSFILNLMINPAANVMSSIYVCGALVAIFIISRWVEN